MYIVLRIECRLIMIDLLWLSVTVCLPSLGFPFAEHTSRVSRVIFILDGKLREIEQFKKSIADS